MKLRTDIVEKFYQFYPKNTTLVGAKYKDKINFMAAAWNTALSFKPPMIGVSISPKRYSYKLIEKAGEFTCNFLPLEKLDILHKCGRSSGSDINKIEKVGIELEDPIKINSPVIKDAYASFECALVEMYRCGDHDLFVGEVLAIHYNESLFDVNGVIKLKLVNPILYLGSNTYTTADQNVVIKKPHEIQF